MPGALYRVYCLPFPPCCCHPTAGLYSIIIADAPAIRNLPTRRSLLASTSDSVKPITSKHVFSLKEDAQGNIERYKVRIVARGFTQQEGVDYQDTFAPVASLESIRIILALAVCLGLYTDQMDVNTAYLNGELLQTLYMLPPTGVDIREGYCWRLKKSVYDRVEIDLCC